MHGGAAPQVRRKAEERLASQVDVVVLELLRIAVSADNEAVRLAACRDVLDRAGIGKQHPVRVELAAWQVDIAGLVVDLDPPTNEVVDAEVVEDQPAIPPSDWESEDTGETGDPDPPRYPRQADSNVLPYPTDSQRHRWRR